MGRKKHFKINFLCFNIKYFVHFPIQLKGWKLKNYSIHSNWLANILASSHKLFSKVFLSTKHQRNSPLPTMLLVYLWGTGQIWPVRKYSLVDRLDELRQENIFLYRTKQTSQGRKPSQMYSVSPYCLSFKTGMLHPSSVSRRCTSKKTR